MRWWLSILLLIPLLCFAQKSGTVFLERWGHYYSDIQDSFYVESDSTATCAYRGFYHTSGCGTQYDYSRYTEGTFDGTAALGATSSKFHESGFIIGRDYALFNTTGLRNPDSAKVSLRLVTVLVADNDSLWMVGFQPRDNEDCALTFDSLADSCNFYRCSAAIFQVDATNSYATPADTGWVEFNLDTSLFDITGYTAVGFITRREPMTDPTGANTYRSYNIDGTGQTAIYLTYWFTSEDLWWNYGTEGYGLSWPVSYGLRR